MKKNLVLVSFVILAFCLATNGGFAQNKTTPVTKEEVLTFLKTKSDKRIEQGCGGILEISVSQKASFKTLNAFRNKFMHFTPTSWSIEISGLPQIIGDIFDIIAQIASDGWPFRHLESKNRDELSALLARIKGRLVALESKIQSEAQS